MTVRSGRERIGVAAERRAGCCGEVAVREIGVSQSEMEFRRRGSRGDDDAMCKEELRGTDEFGRGQIVR